MERPTAQLRRLCRRNSPSFLLVLLENQLLIFLFVCIKVRLHIEVLFFTAKSTSSN